MGDSSQSPSTPPPPPRYSLPPTRLPPEDILFCVDVDVESLAEMKLPTSSAAATSSATSAGSGAVSGGGGSPSPASQAAGRARVVTRLDCIKQGLLMFLQAKSTMSTEHRFAFSTLNDSAYLVSKDFSNDVNFARGVVLSLIPKETAYGVADLTQLFKMASNEGKRSRLQGRLLRVVLIYCRSSVQPKHQWPVSPKLFTMDVIYLHDKPSSENCPQKVYDALVDALEHVTENEGYILESGQGLPRVLFRHMCVLLSHPMQRCMQDDLDIPKSLTKKTPASSEVTSTEDSSLVH